MAKEKEPCCWGRQVGETEVKQEDLEQVSALLRAQNKYSVGFIATGCVSNKTCALMNTTGCFNLALSKHYDQDFSFTLGLLQVSVTVDSTLRKIIMFIPGYIVSTASLGLCQF